MLKFFDTYTIKARIAPVFIVLFPMILIASTIGLNTNFLKSISGSTLIALSLSILGAQFSRDRGKKKEKELWKSWGGAPTTDILRYRNTDNNQVRCLQLHKKLQTMFPELSLPSREEELNNPEKADEIYEACTRSLIVKTRDTKKFPLVFKENVNYGFLRNLWGMRAYGIFLSLIGLAIAAAYFAFALNTEKTVSYEFAATALLNLTLLLIWIFWVTSERIKVAAIAYAERLYECCE